ncbi:hypothetical protein CAPTEDRAFT_202938 [Capitella teleta]|uniref:Uncharacterized protein n=1 Tax=Capitella teleta TaxID=283909 RepID=R7TQG7_CAPTE|nr:hypothetical protein CAPTEDRAFT_202938 [Capitella teleta]|eukprot:ELT95894.1 hypothetical protein CAPTEDRAFT_202938 [Capitella teleta]
MLQININFFAISIGALILVTILASSVEGRLLGGLLEDASDKGCDFIAAHITDSGQNAVDDLPEDLYSYFKLPLTLFTCGRLREANLVLDHIKVNFLQPDGDFKTTPDLKSVNPDAQSSIRLVTSSLSWLPTAWSAMTWQLILPWQRTGRS